MVVVSEKYNLPIGSLALSPAGEIVAVRSLPHTSWYGLGTVVSVEYLNPKDRDKYGVWQVWPDALKPFSA